MRALKRLALAAMAALALAALAASPAAATPYGIESAEVSLSSNQAGAHADFTTGFVLTKEGDKPAAFTRDLRISVPPGLAGNPQGVPICTTLQFGTNPEDSECPISSQVGVSEVLVGGNSHAIEPVYNLTRPAGGDVVARFGFYAFAYPIVLNVKVDPITFGLVVSAEGAPAGAKLISSSTTIWGVPAAHSHDSLRATPKEASEGKTPPGGKEAGVPPTPFLTNPTSCGDPGELEIEAVSYQEPENPASISVPMPQIVGCDSVKFFPSFTIAPTNPEAAAPSGIEAELKLAQDESPEGRGTSPLRYARVTLPQGFAINPAAGDGLEACSAAQVNFENPQAPHCPDASKLGSAEIQVPALEHALHASIYQRTPEPGRLFGFWLVTDELGVRLKLPAQIEANPLTGQLTTVFNGTPAIGGNPQFPVEDLKLRFSGGPRAPIATPNSCATYQSSFEFTPWSGNPAAKGSSPMQITTGCGKGGFNPGLLAGTLNPRAGAFTSMVFQLTRQDGEANPATLTAALPQGLIAKLAGVPLCPAAEAATGNCPEASKIGSVSTAAGVGGAPLWIPQPGKAPTAIYLSGPYSGAPYSMSIVVPAQAGPFDLGTVVTRAGITVDPESAVVHVASDPLPQILEGVPVAYRAIRVDVDRPEFVLNPTDCDPKQISAHVVATNGAVADPSTGYQATNCANLHYATKLKIDFKGKTKRTGHPAVTAKLTQPFGGQSNNAATTVILPASEFIDQNHINNPCTRVQFAADACPPKSILGTVKATTPLLSEPLTGKLYFRSNGGDRELPDIVADIRGAGLRFVQVGFVDSVGKKGSETRRIRTRFLSIPDAPLTKVSLSFFGGKRGLLVNSQNLCLKPRYAEVALKAQNDLERDLKVKIHTDCPKGK